MILQAYDEKRRKKDEQREAQVKAEEEEAVRKEAERQAAEDAEAAKWLGQISVEKEGDEATEDAEQQVRGEWRQACIANPETAWHWSPRELNFLTRQMI